MTPANDGYAAHAEFVAKVRRRITFGAPADVVGTAGVNTKRFVMATWAWAWGYEQAIADRDATTAVFEKAFSEQGPRSVQLGGPGPEDQER